MSGSTFTWTGATNNTWATSTNWAPLGPPASGDTVDINSGTPNTLTLTGTELNDDTVNLLNGATIAFANGATLDGLSTVTTGAGMAGTIDATGGVFTDFGNIQVSSGQTLVVSMQGGATLLSNGPSYSGAGTDVGINSGGPGEFNGGSLYVLGGTLDNQEIHVNGGYTDVTAALESNDEFSLDGGLLEIAQQSTVSPAQITFINADTSAASTLKFDNPTLFDGDGNGVLYAFEVGDTLDIGAQTVGTIVYTPDSGINGGTLVVENASGSALFTAQLSGGDAPNFAGGAAALNGGTVAGSFQVVTAGNGDVLISEASSPGTTTTPPPGPATWSWNGGSGSYASSNWTAVSGTNVSGYPVNGDTALVPTGTVDVSGATLDLANLNIGGVSGAGVAVSTGGSLEVNGGLSMLGGSTLSVDGSSAIDLGTSGYYTNGAVTVDGGASLIGSGLVIAASITDNGQIISSNAATAGASTGGTLELTGNISGAGGFVLGSGSALLLDGGIKAGSSVAFNAGSAETLVLGTPGTAFANAITGLANGDWIEFGNGITVDSASVVNGNTIDVNITSGGSSSVYDLTNVGFAVGAGQSFTAGTGPVGTDSGIELGGSAVSVGTTTPGPITISGAVAGQTDIDALSIAPLSGVTIADTNVSQTETVTVTLSAAANGTLTNLGGGSYNSSTGVYSVTGSAAAVTSAIDGLQFNPTYGQVSSGSVTTGFAIAVTDTLDQTASNDTASVVTTRSNAAQSVIYQDYENILGRAPDAGSLAYWQSFLTNGTTAATVAHDIATSSEAQGDINTIYEQVLGRPVDAAGLAYWESTLANGSSLATVRTDVATSSEAQGDINTIYQQILSRPVDAGPLAYWESTLASGSSLATVRATIASSSEAQGDINTIYQQVLGRSADLGGLAWWEQTLANGSSMVTVRADIASSVEAQGDINTLYERILGRAVDAGGLGWWEHTLATGGSLTTVSSDLATSAEATADLTASYQAAYSTNPNQGVVATLEGRLAAGATLSAVESSLSGPLVYDTVSGQAATDQSTVQPFGAAVVTDPNTGDIETATITLTNGSNTATDANGVLSGTGLIHTGTGTYVLANSTAAGLTSALEALVFTPTTGQVSVGQSVTTNMSISVNDTVATGSDTVTSITATAVSSPTNLNFIYGSAGSDTFTEATSPAVIGENVNPLGNDAVTNFNVAQDVVQLSAAMFANYAAVTAAITNVSGSAVLHFDSADSLTLQGVSPGSLTASNFRFV